MRKLVPVLVIAMVFALAFTVAANAEVWTPQEDELYDITFDLGTDKTGTMYGMVVIEAADDAAAFELNEDNIRYIDQVTANGNTLSFTDVGPMALKDGGNYYVYIGGGDYNAATKIGTLSETAEPPVVTPVVPTAVTLSQTTATLEIDGTVTLTETVTPAEAEYTAEWTSSAPAVAEVVDGVVTAKTAGTAIITVKVADGVEATCEVTVNAAQTPGEETILYGDVDNSGAVNRLDGTFLARNLAKWTVFNNTDYSVLPNEAAADVDASGAVNRLDGTSLARYHAKWTVFNGKDYSQLPVQDAAQ